MSEDKNYPNMHLILKNKTNKEDRIKIAAAWKNEKYGGYRLAWSDVAKIKLTDGRVINPQDFYFDAYKYEPKPKDE